MSCSKMRFDAFFDKLPFVALAEICRHLDSVDIITHSLNFPRLKSAIRSGKARKQATCHISMKDEQDTFKVYFPDDDDLSNGFIITFQHSSEFKDGVHLKRSLSSEEVDYHHCPAFLFQPHILEFYSGNVNNLQNVASQVLNLIGELLTLEYKWIVVQLETRHPDIPIRQLTSLPPGNAFSAAVRVPHTTVNCGHIEQFLTNIQFTGDLEIKTDMDRIVKWDCMNLTTASVVHIQDARFMTRRHMETAMLHEGSFGKNSLTNEDFNVFLRRWKEGNANKHLSRVTFEVQEHQNITLEGVLDGLDARPWDPNVRERSHFERFFDNGVDLKDGLDMENVDGLLGTVHLSEKELLLITWKERFPVRVQEEYILLWIEREKERLRRNAESKQRMEEDLDEDPSSELTKRLDSTERYIRACRANIEEMERSLARLRSECM